MYICILLGVSYEVLFGFVFSSLGKPLLVLVDHGMLMEDVFMFSLLICSGLKQTTPHSGALTTSSSTGGLRAVSSQVVQASSLVLDQGSIPDQL